MSQEPRRLLLVILDGWGLNPQSEGNAIAMGNTPVYHGLMKDYPSTSLVASGAAIDLPPGHMGNSEVGHQNIGAGRIVPQASSTITRSINDGTFFDGRRVIPKAIRVAKHRGATVHLFGLLSDGLVHSHINHAFALIKLAKEYEVAYTVHALLDGRDVPPMSAKTYIQRLLDAMASHGIGKIGTVTGRTIYERDHEKWHLVKQLHDLLVANKGKHARSALAAVEDAYNNGITIDEHIPPYVIVDEHDKPVSEIRDGDVFINWNFRGDRATMISHALVSEDFNHFKRLRAPTIQYICMSLYDDDIPAQVAFPPVKLHSVLSEVICKAGLRQFKTAETTKFYHLTFFFNCRRRRPFPCEVQVMIPSKKTEYYDEMPEMSAAEVGDSIIQALRLNQYEFLAVNFANPDMVGHTGNLKAAIKAVETVDYHLGRVVSTAEELGYTTIVTADHGNAEQMINETTGKPHTAHSANDVPFILIPSPSERDKMLRTVKLRRDGLLGNIAPTILVLMGLQKPPVMTCESLIK
ncbi:2,3-bisphosphoglycerate-independent phosphoglycerate mutase [[Eubacterium] cellulosolvens]